MFQFVYEFSTEILGVEALFDPSSPVVNKYYAHSVISLFLMGESFTRRRRPAHDTGRTCPTSLTFKDALTMYSGSVLPEFLPHAGAAFHLA